METDVSQELKELFFYSEEHKKTVLLQKLDSKSFFFLSKSASNNFVQFDEIRTNKNY